MAGKRDTKMVVSRRCRGTGEGHAHKLVWKLYLMSKCVAFKVLLVLDNVPGQPEDIDVSLPDIEI